MKLTQGFDGLANNSLRSRWTYLDFLNRYRLLAPKKFRINKDAMRQTCEVILTPLIKVRNQ